jgi:hypothetical protein
MTKRWMTGLAAVGALAAACGGARLPTTARGETLLTVRGQVKGGPFHLGRLDLAALPRAGFRAVDPASGREARFDGVALTRFMGLLEATDRADTLILVGQDGMAVPVPAGLSRQYGPILADQIDGQAAPLQLAWPNLDQRGLDADPRASTWWAHEVVALEVVAWERAWGRALRAPPGVSDEARRGAGQFQLRCATCHRLHGAGGQNGPALDGVVTRLGRPRFVAAVLGHRGWPERLGTELEGSEAVAAQVAAFLVASEVAGPQASDEPPPAPQRRSPPRAPGT